MRKKIRAFILLLTLSALLCGCGQNNKEAAKALDEYKKNVETIFNDIEAVDASIKEINPNDDSAVKQLFNQFEKLNKAYSDLNSLTPPTEGAPNTFSYIPSLTNEASQYMSQSLEYFNDAFSEKGLNENIIKAAFECYERANKRLLYVIELLQGNFPQGDNITYNN